MDEGIDILISSEESVEQWAPIPLYIEAPSPPQCDPSQKEEGEDGCVIIIDIAGEEE